MADISIVQEHQLTQEQARTAAQQVVDKIASEYGLECSWKDDVLNFERGGVQGALTLHPHKAEIVINLGFMMGMFAPAIGAKVAERMKKVFAAT